MADVLDTALTLYLIAVFAWVVLSWIPMSSGHPLGKVQYYLDRIIGPVIRPIRRVIPPIRLGGGALDLSPIILLIGIQIIRGLIR
ncbi:MAG: YggT family protein [Actinobacteria bacterium]|nr:YggT family protein [Actinomycetota bacterium]MCI0543406.1 YggT family protein [Actinomycetota bacterium]MCI0679333.1 YggT family protein [Actinomycetota bacterium]